MVGGYPSRLHQAWLPGCHVSVQHWPARSWHAMGGSWAGTPAGTGTHALAALMPPCTAANRLNLAAR